MNRSADSDLSRPGRGSLVQLPGVASRPIGRPIAIMLFLIAAYFAVTTYRDSNPYLSDIANLRPVPDTAEYVLLGQALAKGSLTPEVNGHAWITRYPPLMSMIIAPLFYLVPSAEEIASIAPLIMGLSTLFAAFFVMRRLLGDYCAIAFAALLASSQMFQMVSWHLLTEAPSLLMILVLILFLSKEIASSNKINIAACGLLCGLLIALRLQNLFAVSGILLASSVTYRPLNRGNILYFVVPFGMMLSIYLAYNWIVLGNPFMTGYAWQVGGTSFSPAYLVQNLKLLARLIIGLPVKCIFITWPQLAAGMPIFAVLGALLIWRRFGWRAVASLLVAVAVSTAPMLFYYFLDVRFDLYLVVAIYGLAAAFLGLFVIPHLMRAGEGTAIAIALTLVLFWPGVGRSSPFAFAKEWAARAGWRADDYILAQFLKTRIERDRKPAVFISGIYLPLAAHWMGQDVTVYPIGNPQCYSKCFGWVETTFGFTWGSLVRHGSRVYLSDAGTPTTMMQPADFDKLRADLASKFSVTELKNPSRWKLYSVASRDDPN